MDDGWCTKEAWTPEREATAVAKPNGLSTARAATAGYHNNAAAGLPAFYELHAWLWTHNPSGMFNDWNPRQLRRRMTAP